MKYFTFLAVLLATLLSSLAQGLVNFANRVGAGGSVLNAPITLAGSQNGPGPDYSVELLLSANGSLTPLTPTSTFNPAGTGAAAISSQFWSAKTVDVPGVFGGQSAVFVVRAWKTSYGSFAAAFSAGETGASDPFTVIVGGAGQDPSVPPATPANLVNLKPFTVGVVPEPSILALAFLGTTLLTLRRKSLSGHR
jgi:hypothetical protein